MTNSNIFYGLIFGEFMYKLFLVFIISVTILVSSSVRAACTQPQTCTAGQASSWNGSAWTCVKTGADGGPVLDGTCSLPGNGCATGVKGSAHNDAHCYEASCNSTCSIYWNCYGLNGGSTALCTNTVACALFLP